VKERVIKGARMKSAALSMAFGLLLTIPAVSAGQGAQAQPAPVPTFTKDVAPILYDSCVNCHRPNQVAPMSLLTYEEARPWARSIKERVARREMPPWHINRTVGIKEYRDDPSLSDEEIDTVVRWVDGGAPRGNPADMPQMPKFPSEDEWSIGTPDLIVDAPTYTVKANMADWFGSFYVDSGLTEDRWVQAIEVKPGDKRVVHHTIVYTIQDDEEDLAALVPEREPDGFNRRNGTRLIEYAIGNLGDVYEDGTARLMKAGAKIHFAAHYHAIQEDVTETTRVGIKFYPKGYTPKHILQNKLVSAHDLDIPPGQGDVRNEAFFTLKKPTKLILFQPHMHYRGKAMSLEAIYPDRRVELLTYVDRFDVMWQVTYPYKNPPVFPAGTVLRQTSWHDNTANNKRNPDPTNWVGSGNRTIDEMSIGHIDFIYLSEEEYQEELRAQQLRTTQQQ
jgi:hypothetical protein